MDEIHKLDYIDGTAYIKVIEGIVETALRECPAVYNDSHALGLCEGISAKLQELGEYMNDQI